MPIARAVLTNRLICLYCALSLFIASPSLLVAEDRKPSGENIALGKTYTLDPKPNYDLCTDSGDTKQLTDGQYSGSGFMSELLDGSLWTQLPAVGWRNTPMAQITLDLGFVLPISGVSFNTAAGTSAVEWPTTINILVSNDGILYYNVGELIALSVATALPPPAGYSVHRFWTKNLATHGRFVKLLVHASGAFIFSDEIEIYSGDAASVSKQLPGTPITDVEAFYLQGLIRTGTIRRITRDAEAIRAALSKSTLPTDDQRILEAKLTAISTVAKRLPDVDLSTFRAVLPLNKLHARLFRIQASLWRAARNEPLTVWKTPLWDPLSLIGDLPRSALPVRVQITMMQGEYRAGSFNLSNTTDQELTVRLGFEKLPLVRNPTWVTVHEVAWTDTKIGTPVASALPEAKRQGKHFLIKIPSGMTRQVWLTFHPTTIKPGIHESLITLHGDGFVEIAIPLHLKVSPIKFSTRPTLHLGGWDYTDAERVLDVTPQNRDALIAHLREHFVDTPWATSGVMPAVPNFKRFDTWLERWPGARDYRVYLNVGNAFAGAQIWTQDFKQSVGIWISAYAKHMKKRGLKTSQLGVLLVDEPYKPVHDEIIIAWAQAIRAAEPEVIIWENPTHKDPAAATAMLAACDVLCPHRPMFLTSEPTFRKVYVQQRDADKVLNFYSCLGPVRSLDPYTYHRLQAWTSWKYGATAEFFWAFGDNGGGSSWNEYAARGSCYTPLFLDGLTVTAGKHMEAIREGVEDFEYLAMLRRRIEQLELVGTTDLALSRARSLLASAANHVLDATGAEKLNWADLKDRTSADIIRIEILESMEALRHIKGK